MGEEPILRAVRVTAIGVRLRAGHRIRGPAIIEEPFTTIVLPPRQSATLERNGNYRIELA